MTKEARDPSPVTIEELYRAPAAEAAPVVPQAPADTAPPFYVVSATKFLVLFVTTFGVYQLYWFFAHWRQHRKRAWVSVSPIWRALFSLFFAHRLFALIAEQQASSAGQPAAQASWAPSAMASLYVVLIIGSRLVHYLGPSAAASLLAAEAPFTWVDSAEFLLEMAAGYPLFVAQMAANAACGDPRGASNTRLTALNYLIIVLGAAISAIALFGMLGE